MRHFAVAAIGRDRPGIVAAVTANLLDHDLNVEDSQMTILGGHFTMMLEVVLPEGLTVHGLDSMLQATRRDQGVEITIRALEPDAV